MMTFPCLDHFRSVIHRPDHHQYHFAYSDRQRQSDCLLKLIHHYQRQYLFHFGLAQTDYHQNFPQHSMAVRRLYLARHALHESYPDPAAHYRRGLSPAAWTSPIETDLPAQMDHLQQQRHHEPKQPYTAASPDSYGGY